MNRSRLGQILVDAGKLTPSQLDVAMRTQQQTGVLLGKVLTDLGYIGEKDIAQALAEQLAIPFIDLDDTFRLEAHEVKLIPKAIAQKFCLIPMQKNPGDPLTVVMRDPLDIQAVDTVRVLANVDVLKAVSTGAAIQAVIERYYRLDAHIEEDLKDLADTGTDQPADLLRAIEGEEDQLRVMANDAPVVKYVNLVLMQAIRDRASDIHFEPGERCVRVRLRVDGNLQEITPPPSNLYAAIVTRIKILSDMDIAEKRLPLDGRFKSRIEGRIVDVRVSSIPEIYGEKIVLRVLDRQSLKVDLTEIGFDAVLLPDFQRILKFPHGIILLTGPTGSGKTTTLYSALSYLKSPGKNLQTVEDPVEYQLEGINQMQIRPTIGLDFANALRAILRQDPDILMIGEIRDVETARIAMRASLTGHLVFSTLHTNDAPSACSRLRDIGIEPYLIAATIKLVISQRLVRRICTHCMETYQPDTALMQSLRQIAPEADQWTFRRGAGCEQCSQTGYRGRQALIEFLEINDPVRESILNGASDAQVRATAMQHGMRALLEDGLRKIRDGVTTLDEVQRVWPIGQEG